MGNVPVGCGGVGDANTERLFEEPDMVLLWHHSEEPFSVPDGNLIFLWENQQPPPPPPLPVCLTFQMFQTEHNRTMLIQEPMEPPRGPDAALRPPAQTVDGSHGPEEEEHISYSGMAAHAAALPPPLPAEAQLLLQIHSEPDPSDPLRCIEAR